MFEAFRTLMADGDRHPDAVNVYYPIDPSEIDESERRLGYRFPSELREFFREIGYGFFKSASDPHDKRDYNYINRFLAPSQVADLLLGAEPDEIPSEGFGEGEIPFFEVGDQLYLVVRPTSVLPNQVCWPFGDHVADSLVEFTENLARDARFYQS
jgi:hypothetical protein